MSGKDLFLVADIGTSSCKAAVVSDKGQLLASRLKEYDTYYPAPFCVEHNPHDWWTAFKECCRELLSEVREGPERIIAVSVSGNTPSVLPVDGSGEPIRNAIIWMDRRPQEETEFLLSRKDKIDIEHITANKIESFYPLPKLLWLKKNERRTFSDAHMFIQSNGYIVFKLTGNYSIDVTQCTLLLLYDVHKNKWSEEILSLAELDPEKLPPVMNSWDIVGEVGKNASAETGIPEGTPVVAGLNDSAASSLGVGMIKPMQSYIMLGQAGGVGITSEKLNTDTIFLNYYNGTPDLCFSLAPMAACGASVRWARDQLIDCDDTRAESAYKMFDDLASGSSVGANGVVFLPYMIGERAPIWDAHARGVFFGLSLSTKRADLFRAILEGTSFSILHNINTFENLGYQFTDILCTGGGSRSAVWKQIIADVSGKNIYTIENEDNVTLGNALIAGYGVGIFPDLTKTVDSIIKTKDTYHPEKEKHDQYKKLYKTYRDIYEHTKDDSRRLLKLQVV